MRFRYPLSADGIAAFKQDTLNDIFDELDKEEQGHPEDFNFIISCGDRSICIPCCAEEYELLCNFLDDVWEVEEDNE